MKRLIIYAVLIGLFYPYIVSGQTLPDEFPRAQSLFAKAQRLMRQQDYPAAIDAYNELVKGFKNSAYRDIYQYGLARAYYHLGDFKQAEIALAGYPKLFPNSYLLPYAYHLMANCQYRRGKLESAFKNYIAAYRKASDDRLRTLSERSILASVEAGYFPADSVLRLVPGAIDCQVKARMAFLMRNTWGQEAIDSFMAGCPENLYKQKEHPKPSEGDKLTVGIMVPLSGPFSKYGHSILDGAMLAADSLKKQHIPLEILAYDTQADNVIAARQALILANANVDLIVGPLMSNVAATVAAALNNRHIPLLVPAASQAGFTDLSPTCYQMTPNMITVGKGMARYAVEHRGMTTLAVMAPTSIDELTMAEAFVREAKRLGAHILAFERFRPGETDFGPYIKDIKEAILGPIDDSTFFVTINGDTLRPGEVAVDFDGMFIPAGDKQLYLILPQLDFYRINTTYLGTDEWNSPKVKKLGAKVIKNAIFYSSKAAMSHSYKFDAFSAAYDIKYGSQPNRLAALGYDAISLLGDAYLQGKHGPGDIAEFLSSLSGYETVSGKISFGKSRSNIELPLFTYENGKIKPLTEQIIIRPEEKTLPPDTVGTQYIKYEY